jgi:DNA-binding NtrC family response regulator
MSVAYIIDDHLDSAETMSLMLRSEGFNSAFFTDFTDALDAITSGHPCIVFADYHSKHHGVMTAEEFLGQLRQTHPDLPVYLMSGDARLDEAARGRWTGFLLKPIESAALTAVARRHCSSTPR